MLTADQVLEKLKEAEKLKVISKLRQGDIEHAQRNIERLTKEISEYQTIINDAKNNIDNYFNIILESSENLFKLIFEVGYFFTYQQQQIIYDKYQQDLLKYAAGKWKRLAKYCCMFKDFIGLEEKNLLVSRLRGVHELAVLKRVFNEIEFPDELKERLQYHIDRLESIEVMKKLAQ